MRVFGLIGYPLGHSFSKQYFTAKFQREGLTDCLFEAFPIASINEFPRLLQSHPQLEALCVTIPYKEQVLQFVDERSGEVAAIGATNSITIRRGKLTAYNTDIVGFEKSFAPLLAPHHKKALVLGTGGASKAVQYVLEKMGIAFRVVSRHAGSHQLSYQDLDAGLLKEYHILINCTPVGMHPADHLAPLIPYDQLTPDHYLYDLVYKPEKTLFFQRGEAKGATVKNGYDMLLLQAEESWRIWNDSLRP